MSAQETNNIIELEAMLRRTVGGNAEAATPIVASQRANDLIVDFNSDTSRIYPIFPEYEEPLEPADLDAYGDTVN